MKICIVTHTLRPPDGQGRVNYEIARHLAGQGHQVTLISRTIDPALAVEPNVTWRPVSVPSWLTLDLFRYQAFAVGARRALRQQPNDFDIIHLNGAITYHPADVNASHFVHSNWLKSPYHTARVSRGAYALYQRGVTAYNAWWEKRAYRDARRVVAVSDFVRDSLVADAGVAPSQIEVIYNGVDTAEFRPLQPGERNLLREELEIPDQAFLIFFSGGIKTNRKNLDLPMRAVAALGPRYHLAVAGTDGGGPYPALARELGISDRVYFLGHREDVPGLLRGADAFAFASHYDPFALVIPEAMASGVPVITAPSVGASALITHGENGFVIRDSGDLQSMITVLQQIAKDPQLVSNIRRNARETAETMTWEAMALQYEALYERIWAAKQGRVRENAAVA